MEEKGWEFMASTELVVRWRRPKDGDLWGTGEAKGLGWDVEGALCGM